MNKSSSEMTFSQHTRASTAQKLLSHESKMTSYKQGIRMLDLSRELNTTNHALLLHTLEHDMMVSGVALDWFRSYLSQRTQAIAVKGKQSSKLSAPVQCSLG